MKASVPSFHISSRSRLKGKARVFIDSRQDTLHTGRFEVAADVHFDPTADAYPVGTLKIKVDLSESAQANFSATSVELTNAFGKHNPTVALTGRCTTRSRVKGKGFRYWLLVANNKQTRTTKTPDIVSFAIHDNAGNQVAYGTGPVAQGDLEVRT